MVFHVYKIRDDMLAHCAQNISWNAEDHLIWENVCRMSYVCFSLNIIHSKLNWITFLTMSVKWIFLFHDTHLLISIISGQCIWQIWQVHHIKHWFSTWHDSSFWVMIRKPSHARLPYLRSLSLQHCLDPMHIFKNVCKSFISHLVGEKNNVVARRLFELQILNHPIAYCDAALDQLFKMVFICRYEMHNSWDQIILNATISNHIYIFKFECSEIFLHFIELQWYQIATSMAATNRNHTNTVQKVYYVVAIIKN